MKNINAYPNFAYDDMYVKQIYNLNKWLEAMRIIYTNVHFGRTFKESFGIVTSSWDAVERKDFEAWLDYYQSDNQNKYKKAFANFYVNENIPGYFIPNNPKNPTPPPVIPDLSEPVVAVQKSVNETLSKEEKRKKIEDQRKKIIGRLNAAVKHLTSHEGHMLAGEEFEKLLAGMYELIKQIQTVNKVSLSNQLYYDLIIRQSNKLELGGFSKSAGFLKKFAQNNSGRLDASGPIPVASTTGGTAGGTLENPNPPIDALPMNQSNNLPVSTEEAENKGPLDELIENLETAGLTDSNFSYDDEEELEKEIELDDELFIEAQLASPPVPLVSQAPQPVNPQLSQMQPESNDLEVSLPDSQEESVPAKDIDNIIDSALSNISIKDVVKKIEDVNAIFQNRTIARELSIIDLMLSTLGLSSYFNNLSEIIQKNHEASNYSISRLSDILTKLRGAISDDTVELKEPSELSPEVKQLQQRLQDEKSKEENRKEIRKQLQDNALDAELQETTTPKVQPQAPQQTPAEEIANVPTQIVQ